MNRRVISLLLFVVGVILAVALMNARQTAASAWTQKVDQWVLDKTADGGEAEFLVYLKEQADVSGAYLLKTKAEKGQYVYEQLTAVAARTQPAVTGILDGLGVEYQPYWVANMIWVKGDASIVQRMAEHNSVAHLYANPAVKLQFPELDEQELIEQALTVEWNIALVNADDVWAEGYTGQGAVIGAQDTGYDWDHPALINKYRGWNGSTADHNYNWHDSIHGDNPNTPPGNPCGFDSPQPCDDNNHGTHTAGTMVGDDGGANQIGMAPGARWIGCRNMEQGWGTPTTYSECYQWFIAPTDLSGNNPDPTQAPHVIGNSWGCPPVEGCTDPNVLLTVVQNVRAAGIVTVHSAGNDGSACSTVNTPAGIYDESFSVAATNSSDIVAGFSSRGPVTVDGSNRPKPDISAPGVSIRSSVPGGGYQGGWSGTSMASPHVTGLVALLIAADPSLAGQVDLLETIIGQTAVPRFQAACGNDGDDRPNNTYGWGRIDALEAVYHIPYNLAVGKEAPAVAAPGALLTYTLTVQNLQPISTTFNLVLTDTIPAGTTFVTATMPYILNGTTVEWNSSSLAGQGTWSVDLVVQVDSNATGPIVNSDYGVLSDEVSAVSGEPVSTELVPLSLELTKAAADIVGPGQYLTYTLSVVNPHPSSATYNLVLSDTIPAGTNFVNASEPYTLNGNIVEWDASALAAGNTWNVELVVQVDITATGSIVNDNYGVQSDEVSTVQGTPVTSTIVPFDLAINKTAVLPVITPGHLLTYTLTVNNPHPVASTHNLVLLDTIPDNTSFVSATTPYTLTGDVVQWDAAALAAGGTWDIQLVVQVDIGVTGTITNATYGVQSDEVAFVSGSPVTTEVEPFVLRLNKEVSAASATSGDVLTYTLTVTNLSTLSPTSNVVLTDTIPAGTTFVSASGTYTMTGDAIQWETASLGAETSWTVELVVQITLEEGTVENAAYGVRSDHVSAVSGAPVTTTVSPLPQTEWLIYLPIATKP